MLRNKVVMSRSKVVMAFSVVAMVCSFSVGLLGRMAGLVARMQGARAPSGLGHHLHLLNQLPAQFFVAVERRALGSDAVALDPQQVAFGVVRDF